MIFFNLYLTMSSIKEFDMNIYSIILKFLWITGELTLLFILISTLTGLLLQFLTSEKIYRWISGKGIIGNIIGNIIGAGIGSEKECCAKECCLDQS